MKHLLPLTCLASLFLLTGCGAPETEDPTGVIRFEFDSADGIQAGNRVVYLGTVVGEVPSSPEIQPDGKSVVITANLKNLPDPLKPRVNSRTTAKVEKTDLVMGEKVLALYLSERSDAEPLTEGQMLKGMNNTLELTVWKQINEDTDPNDPNQPWWSRLAGLIYPMSAETVGTGMRIFNLICFLLVVLVLGSMLLDGLHKLFLRERRKEKGSPKFLRAIWILFALTSSLRILLVLVAFIMGVVGSNLPSFPPYVLLPENPITLLQWEWKFLVVFVVVLSMKFKFKLFLLPLRLMR